MRPSYIDCSIRRIGRSEMARTTSDAVNGILEKTATLSLTPFITSANLMVTKHCSDNTDYTTTDLEEIERYLAAHFYHVAKTRNDADRAGPVSRTRRSRVDMGLNLTHYGQMAMRLDWAGGLAALERRIKDGISTTAIGFSWLGTEESELEDIEDT